MAKKCIYCKAGIDESSVVDVCRACGIGVWGEKMFNAINENMQKARDDGNLYQGSVTDAQQPAKNNSHQKSKPFSAPKAVGNYSDNYSEVLEPESEVKF
jgi:hypothetical protein